jgi:predicted acyltransferase
MNDCVERFYFLDVLRGLVVAMMVIVNSPGNDHSFITLNHSNWHGCTLADLVFPFFIIIVGISSVLALSNMQCRGLSKDLILAKVIKRTIVIFLLGVLLNAFPYHFDFATLRWFGVLQRIALCYFCSAIFFLTVSTRGQALLFLIILLAYEGLLFSVSSPLSLEGNLVGVIDRGLFSSNHLYLKIFDPEGLLSTLPAISSGLLGNLVGILLISKKSSRLFLKKVIATGLVFLLLASFWNQSFPINKALWTSSYVLWTGGLLLLLLAVVYYLVDVLNGRCLTQPLVFLGRHALFIYCLHVLLLKVQAMIHLKIADGVDVNLRVYLGDSLFGYLLPAYASLAYSLSFLVVCALICQMSLKLCSTKHCN